MMTTFDKIPITILADPRSGVYRDWTIEAIENAEQIPYSGLWVEEEIGYARAVVTWTLAFATRDDYFAFLAKLRQIGTLVVLAGFQSLKGTQVQRGNPARVYDVLDEVRVARIENVRLYVGGEAEADVTFTRTVDPVTRLAVVS